MYQPVYFQLDRERTTTQKWSSQSQKSFPKHRNLFGGFDQNNCKNLNAVIINQSYIFSELVTSTCSKYNVKDVVQALDTFMCM